MFLSVLALSLVLSVQSIEKTPVEDEVNDALAHAAALYYDARFKESIELLLRIDELLQLKTDHVREKIDVKLHLALDHIGLNENMEAKLSLSDLYALDADYRLDPQQFSPKVLALAEEARAEADEVRCRRVHDDAAKELEAQNATAVMSLIGSMKSKCAGLQEIETGSAELFYKRGVELYKRDQFSDALQDFRNAVKLSPRHELAAQYIDLTQSKLQVTADWLLLDWRKHFDAHELTLAAAAYRRLMSYDETGGATEQMLSQVRVEYRKALSGLVESWKRACATGDTAAMDTILRQASELLPEPSIGEDILAQMTSCTKTGCIQMNPQLALMRLKTRVSPQIPAVALDFVRNSQSTVRVKARIDEQGNVNVTGTEGGGNNLVNNAVWSAVERWKFSPINDQTGPRCVETEIPIVIKP